MILKSNIVCQLEVCLVNAKMEFFKNTRTHGIGGKQLCLKGSIRVNGEAHGATSGRSSSVGFRSWIREAVKGCFWRHAVSIGV